MLRPCAVLWLAVWLAVSGDFSLAAPSSACPPDTAEDELVFLSSNASCSEFYLCANGLPYLLTCPAGLYFNPNTSLCDYSSNVNCTVTGPTTRSPVPPTAKPSPVELRSPLVAAFEVRDEPVCPESDGPYPVLLPNPSNCSTYFICSRGAAVLLPCPAGLLFNNDTWTCDFPENVDCHQDAGSLEASAEVSRLLFARTMSVESDDFNGCPEVDGKYPVLLPNPDDCGSFYMCSHGVAYLEECPAGLLFNNDTWNCDFPQNVNCNQTGTNHTDEGPWGDAEIPDVCPRFDGEDSVLIPNPANCSTFYLCSNGVPYLQACPPGLFFNNNTWSCDFPQNVACNHTESTFALQLLNRETGVVEGCPKVDGEYPVFLPNPVNCSTFYMCSHGVPYLKSCPPYLLFNNDTWTCDFPKNVHCNETGEADALELLTRDTATMGGCPEVDGIYPVLLPNPANCSTFYMCSHGVPYLQACLDGLLFNNSTWTCDYPANVSCGK